MTTTELAKALRDRGLPVTHQRLAVYEQLHKAKDHPSAEELHRRLKPRYPSLSLATVYKTLQALERLGIVSLVNQPHVEARYDAIVDRHHHAICEGCGKIEDLFDARLDELPVPRGAHGFKISSHSVHFRGLCASCARRKTERRKK
jgi:Fur family peroxide stress response transcriptional regulator